MSLTSDAHVHVFVLVEVVVLELVHVVLRHAEVVMIWSWGDAMLLVTGARAGSLLPTAHSAAVSGVVSAM